MCESNPTIILNTASSMKQTNKNEIALTIYTESKFENQNKH